MNGMTRHAYDGEPRPDIWERWVRGHLNDTFNTRVHTVPGLRVPAAFDPFQRTLFLPQGVTLPNVARYVLDAMVAIGTQDSDAMVFIIDKADDITKRYTSQHVFVPPRKEAR